MSVCWFFSYRELCGRSYKHFSPFKVVLYERYETNLGYLSRIAQGVIKILVIFVCDSFFPTRRRDPIKTLFLPELSEFQLDFLQMKFYFFYSCVA